jgi:hypothetical protein
MKIKLIIASIFLTSLSPLLGINQRLYEKISNPQTTAYDLYKEFNNLSIPAFAVDSFRKEWGAQNFAKWNVDFNKWSDYASAANEYIQSLINQGVLAKSYQPSLAALNDVLNTLQTSATTIKNGRITEAQKNDFIKKIKSNIQQAALIEKTAFDRIAQQNPAPAEWVQQAKKSNLTIKTDTKGSISYGTLFAEWDKFQGTKGVMISDNEFLTFLKQIGLTNKFTIAGAANTLDYIIYRLQEEVAKLQKDIETSWFGNEGRRKKIESYLGFITKAQTISNRIKKLFPTASTLQMAQLSSTKDKPAAILYAQASIYQIALNKLLKELLAQ